MRYISIDWVNKTKTQTSEHLKTYEWSLGMPWWCAPSCLTLWDPMDCSPSGSSVHGISQGKILEWVAISFSRGSFQPRDWTHISWINRQIIGHWATREAPCCISNRKKFPQFSSRAMQHNGWEQLIFALIPSWTLSYH